MVQTVSERMAEEAGSSFEQRVSPVRGRTRSFFSTNADDLYRPMEVGNSGLYVDGNLSADGCVRLARRIVEAVRGSDASLRIEVEETTGSSSGPSHPEPSSSFKSSPADLVVALL